MTGKLMCAALVGATLGWMSVTVWAGPPDRKDFLSDAIKGDNSEIRLGQLAARHGGSSGVREYGRTLVTDHTKAKAQASDVARQIGVEPPSGAMLKADVEYAKLRVLSGKSFDREFVGYMVDDHKKDIRDFSEMAKSHNGAVGDLAEKQLPTLRKHLRMAESLMQS
jgi:putative membrane protein